MLRCCICGRALLRTPAYSGASNGRAIYYGPKCAINKGLTTVAEPRGATRAPRQRRWPRGSDQMQLDLLDPQHQTA